MKWTSLPNSVKRKEKKKTNVSLFQSTLFQSATTNNNRESENVYPLKQWLVIYPCLSTLKEGKIKLLL